MQTLHSSLMYTVYCGAISPYVCGIDKKNYSPCGFTVEPFKLNSYIFVFISGYNDAFIIPD